MLNNFDLHQHFIFNDFQWLLSKLFKLERLIVLLWVIHVDSSYLEFFVVENWYGTEIMRINWFSITGKTGISKESPK